MLPRSVGFLSPSRIFHNDGIQFSTQNALPAVDNANSEAAEFLNITTECQSIILRDARRLELESNIFRWYTRQLYLTSQSEDFEEIERDFILLRSPRHTSWQSKEAQLDPQLCLFYSDKIKASRPKQLRENRKSFFVAEKSVLDSWYLRDVTRTDVEKLLRDHFKLSIPLDCESTSHHWVPMVFEYNVEVDQDIWQTRLAIFFDGNVGTSLQPLSQPDKQWYRHKLKPRLVAERYLELWRRKWQLSPQNEQGSIHSLISQPPTVTNNESEASGLNELRGRKRRAVLRQMRTEPPPLSSETLIDKDSGSPQYTALINRGRLRRRERRKQNTQSASASTDQTPFPFFAEKKTSELAPDIDIDEMADNQMRWPYNSGEAPPRKHTHPVPMGMIIDPPQPNGAKHKLDSVHSLIQEFGLPEIRTMLLHPAESAVVRKYHIICYYNPDWQIQSYEQDNYQDKEVAGTEGGSYKIHVADLIDDAGFLSVEQEYPRCFVSVIDVSAYLQNSAAFLTSGNERAEYWHKFNILLNGFEHPRDQRNLPYSLGYGVEHSMPSHVYRKNRWPHFDVDNVSSRDSVRRPHWRAAIKFDLLGESDICGCSWKEELHDLNTCRHIHKEMVEEQHYSKWSRKDPIEIMSDLTHFVRQPYEALHSLEDGLRQYMESYSHEKAEDNYGTESTTSDSNTNSTTSDEAEKSGTAEDEIKRLKKQKEREDEYARKTFDLAVCHLMGLGVQKNAEAGIRILEDAARTGSLKARAALIPLARSYGVDLSSSKTEQLDWLGDASNHGSRKALIEIESISLEKYAEALESWRFAFEPARQDIFNYKVHVEPLFTLENPQLLQKQLRSWAVSKDLQNRDKPFKVSRTSEVIAMAELDDDFFNGNFAFGTLLHLGALFGFPEAVKILLFYGFDTESQNSSPALRTPLLCALNRGHASIVRLLLDAGASCAPLILYNTPDYFCITPTPLHYLVDFEDEDEAVKLAREMVKRGADINYKCASDPLKSQAPGDWPVLKGESVTPLRWAIIRQKSKLVRVFLSLGAKFAYEKYLRPSRREDQPSKRQQGCLLLETPTTNLEILEMFFARARMPGLPSEFSQTPLGLLVSEDDGPERRLRPGFEHFDSIKEALILLLDLQPGNEDVLLWSAVRHDHCEIVQYVVEDLGWDVETRWKGLTMLHTAVLYGRADLVRYFLDHGADTRALTATRRLTCLHLLMLNVRDPETDAAIFCLLSKFEVDIDAKEELDGLTAFHLAVRNQKGNMVKHLLENGANPFVPVMDKIELLSQGRNGYLELVEDRPRIFTSSLTVIGEVLVQQIQDAFYPSQYVADLLVIYIDWVINSNDVVLDKDVVVDSGNGMTLLHLLALVDPPNSNPRPTKKEWKYSGSGSTKVKVVPPIEATISLLQLVLLRIPTSLLDISDNNGDTALHYAAAAHQNHNIEALLAFGASPSLTDRFQLKPIDILALSSFYLGPKHFIYTRPWKSWHPTLSSTLMDDSKPATSKLRKHPPTNMSRCFAALEMAQSCTKEEHTKGRYEDQDSSKLEQLKPLSLAWDFSRMRNTNPDQFLFNEPVSQEYLEIIPFESAINVDVEKDTNTDSNGEYVSEWWKKVRRPYIRGNFVGPENAQNLFGWVKQERKENWDNEWVLRDLEEERNAL